MGTANKSGHTVVLIPQEECKVSGPKDTVATIYNNQGGMMCGKSLGELPRNRMQISNAKCNSYTGTNLCRNKALEIPFFLLWSSASYKMINL